MSIAGLILAGGQGSRMGGVDKGLQPYQGQPLVAHLIENLRPQVDALWISANRHLDVYAAYDCPVFKDDAPIRGLGPLAGIASLHSRLPEHYTHIQIVPCDTPHLPKDLTSRLFRRLNMLRAFEPDIEAVYPQQQYACALVTRMQLSRALWCLQQHERSLRYWLARPYGVACHDFSPEPFVNLNELAQLENPC